MEDRRIVERKGEDEVEKVDEVEVEALPQQSSPV
ncbi:hypothetical protein BFJ66_g1379 [Fusarium oxysporum f. sp. cepae]|jgi:hypothetical protein|nr:hypothetical protein BFJ66_g1379 [Fusarium oxysporum f. sp. cepae]RKK62017.1 hypothetical protein BFJ67_g1440 [Fusarium oxysporum f. sp. cepae]